jgi:LPPG:FO 2-phospho-L-lactate transferase
VTGERVIALCGGIGGAKLARGLYELIGPALTVVVNTGDDFEHLGLTISPDVDTVLYTLADLNDKERGWGRADETWNFMSALAEVGGGTWFKLGDRDLALHVERTRRLREGQSLTRVIGDVARSFGISAAVLPMSDDPVRTIVVTDEGALPFQKYFVGLHCAPIVRKVTFERANSARVSPDVTGAFGQRDVAAIVICPSNPYLSVDPILAVPGMQELLQRTEAPIMAVSPIIGGAAIKGPTTKIMAELAIEATNASIARHYDGIIDGLIIDKKDEAEARALPVATRVTATLMTTLAERVALAHEVLDFARELASSRERVRHGTATRWASKDASGQSCR